MKSAPCARAGQRRVRASCRAFAATATAVALIACGGSDDDGTWETLVEGGAGLENFDRVGTANWSSADGAVQASQGGPGLAYLVSKSSYQDFVMRVEFWVSDDANSGVFLRCQDPAVINEVNCYEANIFDQRADPTYGTGAIVRIAPVPVPGPKAGGQWNVFEITAQGTNLVLVLNGVKTVDVHDDKLAVGRFALQWGRGTVKFRKVQIRSL